jgi:hypothetical protein
VNERQLYWAREQLKAFIEILDDGRACHVGLWDNNPREMPIAMRTRKEVTVAFIKLFPEYTDYQDELLADDLHRSTAPAAR